MAAGSSRDLIISGAEQHLFRSSRSLDHLHFQRDYDSMYGHTGALYPGSLGSLAGRFLLTPRYDLMT